MTRAAEYIFVTKVRIVDEHALDVWYHDLLTTEGREAEYDAGDTEAMVIEALLYPPNATSPLDLGIEIIDHRAYPD